MSEPAWIEHDGSAVCPVPAGHDVEVRFRGGHTERDTEPEVWLWRDQGNFPITHYRDWTAWEQQQASKDDVPRLLTEADVTRMAPMNFREKVNFLRERGLIASEPVDPLRDALGWAIRQHFDLTDAQLDDITDEARARAVTVDPTRAGEG